MNLKLKQKWVRALRSGNYKQGSMALCDLKGERFCCLGVLADIQGFVWAEDENGEGLVPARANGRRVVSDTVEKLPKTVSGGIDRELQADLIDLNDGAEHRGIARHSFLQIADWIEENL